MTTLVLQQPGLSQNAAWSIIIFFIVISFIILLFFIVPTIVGMWKVFRKANEPGWAAIIPIYNFVVLLQIGGNEWWWILVMFVPFVNIYAIYLMVTGVAEAFGQGIAFALGLWFLPFIFYPLLGFGDYQYQTPPP